MVHMAPSILAADFARLGEQVLETEKAGAQRIHIDVMDGHFVPNLSMGPAVVTALRPVTRLPLEVHLMVDDPSRFADIFIESGADTLLVHHEVLPNPGPLLKHVRERGRRIGMVVNPETPIDVFKHVLREIDVALCMTVNPGFGGQRFLAESPGRIGTLRRLIDQINPECELEVDGGIDLSCVNSVVTSGATVLVVGTAIFHSSEGPSRALGSFRALADEASYNIRHSGK